MVGVGLQTYNTAALEAVTRPFDPRRFEANVKALTQVADTSVELMVGLPGDNPEEFKKSLFRALELPCNLRVYRALVLPDALLTRAPAHYALEFDPITLQRHSCLGWSRDDLPRTMDFLTEECIKRGGSYTVQAEGSTDPCELFAARDDRNYCGSTSSSWYFPGPKRRAEARDNQSFLPDGRFTSLVNEKRSLPLVSSQPEVSVPSSVFVLDDAAILANKTEAVTAGQWRLLRTSSVKNGLLFQLETPFGELGIFAEQASAVQRHYRVIEQVAYTYKTPPSTTMGAERLQLLDRFLRIAAEHVRPVGN